MESGNKSTSIALYQYLTALQLEAWSRQAPNRTNDCSYLLLQLHKSVCLSVSLSLSLSHTFVEVSR
jgi:hypothetical protein